MEINVLNTIQVIIRLLYTIHKACCKSARVTPVMMLCYTTFQTEIACHDIASYYISGSNHMASHDIVLLHFIARGVLYHNYKWCLYCTVCVCYEACMTPKPFM